MTDKELLKLAAKAAGRLLPHGNPKLRRPNEELHSEAGDYWFWPSGDSWNPLTDDGDALRLAVKLRLDVLFDGRDSPNAYVEVVANEPTQEFQPWAAEAMLADSFAATRRAIVRAAAAIGENK